MNYSLDNLEFYGKILFIDDKKKWPHRCDECVTDIREGFNLILSDPTKYKTIVLDYYDKKHIKFTGMHILEYIVFSELDINVIPYSLSKYCNKEMINFALNNGYMCEKTPFDQHVIFRKKHE